MTAETVVAFFDLTEKVMRTEGECFEVTPERFDAINATRYGQLVREVKPEVKPKAPSTRAEKSEE